MRPEFEDITLMSKPDPKQVQLICGGGGIYVFTFPLSTSPVAEWIEIFYDVWRGSEPPMPASWNDYGPPPRPSPPTSDRPSHPVTSEFYATRELQGQERLPNQEQEAEIKEANVMLQCTLDKLSVRSKYLIKVMGLTNQMYREVLQHREEKKLAEQRAIQEAIDEIQIS